MMGLFGVIAIQAKKLTSIIRENIEVQVFLNKEMEQSKIDKLISQMSKKPYVLKKEDTAMLQFTSKDEAAEVFLKEVGEDFTQFLDDNPLRDSFTFP